MNKGSINEGGKGIVLRMILSLNESIYSMKSRTEGGGRSVEREEGSNEKNAHSKDGSRA